MTLTSTVAIGPQVPAYDSDLAAVEVEDLRANAPVYILGTSTSTGGLAMSADNVARRRVTGASITGASLTSAQAVAARA